MQRGSYEMRNLAVAAEWTNQTLNITQCEWTDNAGSFSGRTSWSRETKAADFQARSTLDAKQFLEAFGFGQLLTDLALTSPPLIELSGSGNFAETAPRVSVIGRAVRRKLYLQNGAVSEVDRRFFLGRRARDAARPSPAA